MIVSLKKQTFRPQLLSYPDVVNIPYEIVLQQLSELISNEIIPRSDKFLKLHLNYLPVIEKVENGYILLATYWSDSAVYLDIFKNGGELLNTKDFLNACDEAGAYTKMAWEKYQEDMSTTPKDIIKHYRIVEHVRTKILASGTHEECLRAYQTLVVWNRDYMEPLHTLEENKELKFIKISRKKGQIERTKCMDGECVGGIMISRENAF